MHKVNRNLKTQSTARRAKKTRFRIQRQARELLDHSLCLLRLCVHRSAKHIYVQAIDDKSGHTVAASSTLDKSIRVQKFANKKDAAKAVGESLGQKLKALNFAKVAFDRSGYPYHGRVQALAEGIRSQDIIF